MNLNRPQSFEPFKKESIEQSICARFEHIVSKFPMNTAISFERKKVSYDELNIKANQIARTIEQKIEQTNVPIALMMNQGIDLLATILGVLKSGNFYVSLDCREPANRTAPIINEVNPSLLIYHTNYQFLVSQISNHFNSLQFEDISTDLNGENLASKPSPESAAYIYFTTGTTGKAKGVLDNHRNVLHNIMRYTNTLGLAPEDQLSLIQHNSFSGAVSNIFSALLNGATVCPFDLDEQGLLGLPSWINEEDITVFHSAPSVFRYLASAGFNYERIRIIRLEGDRSTPYDVQLFQKYFNKRCTLVNGLGATECGLVTQYFFYVDQPTQVGAPIGYAVQDMDVFVSDEMGNSLEVDEIGELVVRSKYLALGYWQDPAKTSKAFSLDSNGYRLYKTGDLGRVNENGCIYYLGRLDNQIKILGQLVNIEEVEYQISTITGSPMVVVRGYFDGNHEQCLAAYIESATNEVSIEKLKQDLAECIPGHSIPNIYMVLEKIPLNSNGKVDHQSLPDPIFDRTQLNTPFTPPKTPLENILATTWSEILGIAPIGVLDDFFQLGGNSLNAARIVTSLQERKIVVNVSNLFEHSNLRSLANFLEHHKSPGESRLRNAAGRARRQLSAIKRRGIK